MLRRLSAIATLALAFAVLASPVGAQSQSRQTFSGTFTAELPDSSTGYRLEIDYRNPEDPEAKPHSVQTILQRLHPGTGIDTSVPERCTASDAQLIAQGESACPADTRVGGGELDVDTGMAVGTTPRVIENRVVFFNADEELILFTESTNTSGPPIRAAGRTEVGDGTLTSQAPPLPGFPPPDPFTAIDRVSVALDAVSTDRGSFITTPSSCPAGGEWTNSATFTYRDGESQTVESASPCAGASDAEGDGIDGDDPAGADDPSDAAGASEDRDDEGFPRGGVDTGRTATPSPDQGETRSLIGISLLLGALGGLGVLRALDRRG
jgi:hypothetical protein